ARYIIDKGIIGKPLTFTASISRDYGVYGEILPHLRKRGGGILFDMGGYSLTAVANLFGPVREVAAFTATNEPVRKTARLDNDHKYFGEEYTIEVSNTVVAALKYDCGVLGTLHLNSDCLYTETAGITVYGTEGILYMADPDNFGGEVAVRKLKTDAPFVFPATHGYDKESRGIGAAEMAWSIIQNRPQRADPYMALNVFETAHAIETSSDEKRVVALESTFERPAELPSGYIGKGFWGPTPESALAL
ncbi:MAG: gfo/Idh/MocA family oxidoreductase, partial [Clostridia bacterium]|nr:gfo/Idh/MocA family oxidoreductase [Clostridia bacterium]